MAKMTLHSAGEPETLVRRLGTLGPDAVRRWGKMSVGGMLCHVHDAYEGLLRWDRAMGSASWAGRNLLRPMALHVPLKWPQGVPTVPDVDQLVGGTRPGEFEADRARAVESLRRFAAQDGFGGRRHPIFGVLTEWEWMRWGWLHADHHLRQFGG